MNLNNCLTSFTTKKHYYKHGNETPTVTNGLQAKRNEVDGFINLNNTGILLPADTHYTTRAHMKIPHYVIYHITSRQYSTWWGAHIIKDTPRVNAVSRKLSISSRDASQKLPSELTVATVYCPPRHNSTKDMLNLFRFT